MLALLDHQLLEHASALSDLEDFRVMAVLLIITTPFVRIMSKPIFKSGAGSAEKVAAN